MKGSLLGACNCHWGCPCNFEAPPTYGHCEGMYMQHFNGDGLSWENPGRHGEFFQFDYAGP